MKALSRVCLLVVLPLLWPAPAGADSTLELGGFVRIFA
ncbi:MAG: hypothetical protein RLZZ385_430, partial [Pseudomonadota bacterium]